MGSKKKRINGDSTKLPYAVELSEEQRKLVADFSFRASNLAGTTPAKRRIARIVKFGRLVYGHPTFYTITPSERHNYTAIRLSRYCSLDPHMQSSLREAEYAGQDAPSLDHRDIHLPEWALRKKFLAGDPRAVADGYWKFLELVVAPILGFRMCQRCPTCSYNTDRGCCDVFGNSSEFMGGACHRTSAAVGMTEAQKITGMVHLHAFVFGERAHQFKTMDELAALLESNMLDAKHLWEYHEEVANTAYPSMQGHEQLLEAHVKSHPVHEQHQDLGIDSQLQAPIL